VQLWVNLPAAEKMIAPRYQDLVGDGVPVRREPGAEIKVFSGVSGGVGGVTVPTKNFVPVTLVEFRLDPGAAVRQDIPADDNAFIVVLEGEGAIGEEHRKVVAGDVAWLTGREAPRSPRRW
jgi:redox-sensitive bicupin YhaK (pirin superfamily)